MIAFTMSFAFNHQMTVKCHSGVVQAKHLHLGEIRTLGEENTSKSYKYFNVFDYHYFPSLPRRGGKRSLTERFTIYKCLLTHFSRWKWIA